MVVWQQGGVLADLQSRMQKTPRVTPGTLYPLAKKQLQSDVPPEVQNAKNLGSAYEQLGVIDDISNDSYGTGGGNYLERAEDIMFRANQVNQQAAMARLQSSMRQYQNGVQQSGITKVRTRTVVSNGGRGGVNHNASGQMKGNFPKLLAAIAGKESGGNYRARNSSSGAMGKYQIMPANIAGPGGWDKEILGRNISIQQFMNSPKLQEAIGQGKLRQYYNKYGAAGAASAWYSGSPTKWKTSYGGQGAYPSIHNYVISILKKMGLR